MEKVYVLQESMCVRVEVEVEEGRALSVYYNPFFTPPIKAVH